MGGGKGAAPADEEDPYAWATSLGMVPDKDALEAMGAGGYLAGGKMGGVNQGNGVKRGTGSGRRRPGRRGRAAREGSTEATDRFRAERREMTG